MMLGSAWPAEVRVDRSMAVDQSIDEVFRLVADPRNHARWHAQARSTEMLGPLRRGARYRQEYAIGKRRRWADFEVIDYEPPVSFAAACRRPAAVGAYRLSPAGPGCEIRSHTEIRVNRLLPGRVRKAMGLRMEG